MDDLGGQWVRAIRSGEWAAAWDVSDRVLRGRDPATRDDPAEPYHRRWVWDGRGFDGARVLVRSYHGLGDAIQYARYLPMLAARAASVTLEVQPALVPLLAQLPGLARIHPFDPAHPLPPADCDIDLTELPHALRVMPGAASAPYLAVPPAPLSAGTIAICHGCGDWDLSRSVPVELFAPLCARHPCVTLMVGPSALAVLNPAGCSFDIMATAALVAGASVVVAVDTMIAHLAGAMGKDVRLLLKAEPDWRWTPGRDDTHWYPTAKIYAETHPGDWPGVVARLAHDLERDLGDNDRR